MAASEKKMAKIYCRENSREFFGWVNLESRDLGYGDIICVLFLVVSASINTKTIGLPAFLAYLPAIFLFASFRLSHRLLALRCPWFTVVYWDVTLSTVVAGVITTIYLQKQVNFVSQNLPIQMVLLAVCMLSFHVTLLHTILRNLIICVVTYFIMKQIGAATEVNSLHQYNTGFCFGTWVAKYMLDLRYFRFYSQSLNLAKRVHAYAQMQSVLYPHQVAAIEGGGEIPQTMPVGEGEAIAISFDTVGSTNISHPGFKNSLEIVMTRCQEIMLKGYSPSPLQSSAFLVKNMGDGFFATVGFPFAVPNGKTKEILALELSVRFSEIFREEMERLAYREPIRCAIGLSQGVVEGFFPRTGVKAYDLRDGFREKTLALAKRHEALCRIVPKFDQASGGASIIMIQERIWYALPSEIKAAFSEWNAEEPGKQIRDSDAPRAYYLLTKAASGALAPSGRNEQAMGGGEVIDIRSRGISSKDEPGAA